MTLAEIVETESMDGWWITLWYFSLDREWSAELYAQDDCPPEYEAKGKTASEALAALEKLIEEQP